MSVLDKFRTGTDSTWMQLLLGAVVVSFIWFGGFNSSGDKGGVVARVNGSVITEADFGRVYRTQENARERQLGRGLSDDEREDLKKTVREKLIEREVILQEAARLGIEVSGEEIARILVNNPTYHNATGKFDHQTYLDALRARGLTEGNFEVMLREELLIDKLRRGVLLSLGVSETELKDKFVAQESRLELDYVAIAPTDLTDDVDMSEAAIQKFLSENKTPIKETYDADFERLYNLPEKVTLSVIRLPVREDGVKVEDLKQRIDGIAKELTGENFAELARRYSEDPSAVDGGKTSETPVAALEPAVSEAVKGLKEGEVSGMVADDTQVRLFRVEERATARKISLEEVEKDIATRLLREKESPKLAAELAEKVLAMWKASGSPPSDLLDPQSLTVKGTGPIPLEGTGKPADPPKDMLKDARTLPVGILDRVYESNGVLWVGRLLTRTEPDLSQFDSMKEELRDTALRERRTEFLEAWTAETVKSARVN